MHQLRRSVARCAGLALVLALTTLCAAAALPAQPPPALSPARLSDEERVQQLVASASAYAVDFVKKASALLAREHYVQEVKSRPSSSSLAPKWDPEMTVQRRTLDSEVAIIVLPGELWLLARDILVVDGRSLPDDERIRLPAVHPSSGEEALRTFRALVEQGSRDNIGGVTRNLNVPTLGLWLHAPWSRAAVLVDYRLEPAFETWVPQQMTERYDSATLRPVFIVGTATYDTFRRFEVSSRIVPR